MPSQFNSLTFDYFVHHSTFSMPAFVLSLWLDGNLINGASFSYRVCFQKCGGCLKRSERFDEVIFDYFIKRTSPKFC